MNELIVLLQILVAASVFFVWVVRYDNIVEEFQGYGLPPWLRDLVGILKLAFALMLVIGIGGRERLAMTGALGMALLMGCALATHFRTKTPLPKRLPALTLLVLSAVIFVANYQAVYGS